MVSDQLIFLLGEETKLKEILQAKPDSEWAKVDLEDVQSKIRKLKKEEERHQREEESKKSRD